MESKIVERELKSKNDWAPNLKHKEINGELKQWFINTGAETSEETKNSYENLMAKISSYETDWKDGKDLYTFTKDEILDMLSAFTSSSVNTLTVYVSIIRKYLALAIEQNYIKTNINVADGITFDDLNNLVNKTKKERKLISREDIFKLTGKNVKNYQDQAIILLCFEGIKGKSCSELENLKTEDIDFDNHKIKVVRDDIQMDIDISSDLKNILFIARLEKEYQLNNGDWTETNRTSPTRELQTEEQTPYFLRPMQNVVKEPNLSGQILHKRILSCLNKYMNLPFMTPSSLYLSGVLDRLMKYEKELGRELKWVDVDNYLKEKHEKLNSFQTFTAFTEFLNRAEEK